MFDNSSPIVAPSILEFNLESFQSHQEQLLQMQREQQEALMRQDAASLDNSFSLEHSFSSQPTSRFTLDSDSAKFAVSAVMNSSQLQPTVAPPSASSKVLVHATLTNGPAKEGKWIRIESVFCFNAQIFVENRSRHIHIYCFPHMFLHPIVSYVLTPIFCKLGKFCLSKLYR